MGKIITYKNEAEKGMYCQLKLDSGERILISIAQSGVKIFKLSLGGLVPTQTIWESSDIPYMVELFGDENEPEKPLLDAIVEKLINYESIEDVRQSFS